MAESGGVQAGEVQSGSVLIVDDDAPIRRLLRRWLETWGYDVIDTGSTVARNSHRHEYCVR